MKTLLAVFIALALILLGQPAQAEPIWTFDTLPLSGDIIGTPGDTVGWGYTLSNLDPLLWLVSTALDAGAFSVGTASADIFDLPILAPGQSVTLAYVPGTAGLFEVTVDIGVPAGTVDSGNFTLHTDWYLGDPTAADSQLAFADQTTTVPYSLTVDQPPAQVPEPAGWLLLLAGLAGLAGRRCWQRAGMHERRT